MALFDLSDEDILKNDEFFYQTLDLRDDNVLKISELGIIYDNNGFEMILDDFFRKLEKNIKSEDYNVLYNERNNNFNITFNGTDYVLELDSETMKNYIEGKYNNITYKLKKLSNTELDIKRQQKEIELEEEKKELAIQRKNEIVENARKGILPNDEAKSLYLEELKKEKRFSFRNIFSIFKKSHEDNENHRDNVEDFIYEYSNSESNIGYIFEYGFMVSVVSLLIPTIIMMFKEFNIDYNLFWQIPLDAFFLPSTIYLYPAATYISKLIKNTINHFKNKRIIKHKIKELEKQLKCASSKSISMETFDKTLEESIINNTYYFKDIIYKQINDLISRLEYINKNDRNKLLIELRKILNEYDTRSKSIEKGNGLIDDNLFKLQSDIVGKIALVESEMVSVRARDITSEEKSKERLLLEERFDSLTIDTDEINNVMEERQNNKVPTKVKSRNKKYNYMGE